MKLNLANPIVFFDLETTGINIAKDRIVEISVLKVYPNGKEEQKTIRVNPGMHIPEEASAIHGIYDEDVKDAPMFKHIARELAHYIEGCDLGGYNSNRFDIPLLAEEFLRAEVDFDMSKRKFVDVQTIFHKMEQRTLSAAYHFYCDKCLEDAHTAAADTMATYEVLMAQLDRYGEKLENNIDFLSKFSTQNKNVDFAGFIIYDDKGVEVFNFGKNKGPHFSPRRDCRKEVSDGTTSAVMRLSSTLNSRSITLPSRRPSCTSITSLVRSSDSVNRLPPFLPCVYGGVLTAYALKNGNVRSMPKDPVLPGEERTGRGSSAAIMRRFCILKCDFYGFFRSRRAFQSTRPSGRKGTPSPSNRARRSSDCPPPAMEPSALTTRCHGSSSGQRRMAQPTIRAARGRASSP